MIRSNKLYVGAVIIEDAEDQEAPAGVLRGSLWLDVIRELRAAGLSEEEVQELLRQREVWGTEARLMKAEGYPYEEILSHLVALKAPWGDVGRALMEAGLSPADMLRAVLPSTDGEDHWPLVQAALLDGPEDADYSEVRGVLEYFFLVEEEILGSLDVDEVQRAQLRERLGVSD
ncbi:MAG: hypothetical protein H6Q00_438 [Holophagaceae bacterium]|nr:hypothetical protein [Holophagaceae bacterium]